MRKRSAGSTAATTLPELRLDLATMTGNVAQAIVDREDWCETLGGIQAALCPAGFLATLRFRERAEVQEDLREHEYTLVELRDAPDRPGRDLVFIAQRSGA